MYLEYYNLREKPFSLTPDPSFLYYSNAHRRAIAFLRYGLQESKGFLQLTGPVGSGKTTLLRAVLSQFDEKTKTAYIINPCASFPELLRAIMKDLEVPHIPPTLSKMELLDFFHDYLLAQVRRGNSVIIIFDESQNLSRENLEEVRMLSNFETAKEKLLQIVFIGQPELIKTLDLPELRQLKQRIQVRYHLAPLRLSEVREYINHRLAKAGSDGRITFTEAACAEVFSFSGGIPRLINAVCDIVLLIGYVSEKCVFDKEDIEEAVRELEGRFDDGQEAEEGPEEDLEEAVREFEHKLEEPPAPLVAAEPEEKQNAAPSPSAAREHTPEIQEAPPRPPAEGTPIAASEEPQEPLLENSIPEVSPEADEEETPELFEPSSLPAGNGKCEREAEEAPASHAAEDGSPDMLAPEETSAVPAEKEESVAEAQPPLRKETPAPAPRSSNGEDGHDRSDSVVLSQTVIGGRQRNHSAPPSRTQGCAEQEHILDDRQPDEKREPVRFDSLRRHGSARRFKTASLGFPEYGVSGGMKRWLKQFVKKYSAKRRPASAPVESDLEESEPAPELPGSAEPEAGSDGEAKTLMRRGTERDAERMPAYSAKVCVLDSTQPEYLKRRSPRVAKIRQPQIINPDFISGKAIILFKDGRKQPGVIARTPMDSENLSFVPLFDESAHARRRLISFKDIAAVRFVDTFVERTSKRLPARLKRKENEIIVALVTGDVITGITSALQSPMEQRFFVVSPRERNARWTLIEKSGAIGILSNRVREGMYAEEFESLLRIDAAADTSSLSMQELIGDEFFGQLKFAAAIREYQEALRKRPDSSRIASKISACNLNIGIQRLRRNNLPRAKRALAKVNSNPYLFMRALRIIKDCDTLMGRGCGIRIKASIS